MFSNEDLNGKENIINFVDCISQLAPNGETAPRPNRQEALLFQQSSCVLTNKYKITSDGSNRKLTGSKTYNTEPFKIISDFSWPVEVQRSVVS